MMLSFYRRGAARGAGFAALCLAGSLAFAPAAAAQTVTSSHLQAARQAIAAIHATDQFDSFLPDTALAMKNELSQRDPNLADMISKTVDTEAMKLVARRADLEKEVARVYAKHFTEAELKDIAKFYNSPSGKKLLKEGPGAMTESVGVYEIWRQGVGQDLAAAVGKSLDQQLDAAAAAQPAAPQNAASAPAAKGAAPAAGPAAKSAAKPAAPAKAKPAAEQPEKQPGLKFN